MKDIVKVGYIGLGYRGIGVLKRCFCLMKDVQIAAVCDKNEQKMKDLCKWMEGSGHSLPTLYTDYHEMLKDPEIDAVVVMTGWQGRLKIAADCMKAGKYTAIEVGGAYNLSECYALVETYEQTGVPVMMLENCCYGRREMAALRMAREGMFGDIVLCSGGYHHDLRHEDLIIEKDGIYDYDHYRMAEYMNRNCEQYPTHELGPISKILNLNRGNRMIRLRSIASGSKGLESYIKENLAPDHPYYNAKIKQSDFITTIIDCINGEQIILTLDTTLPREDYSREFTIRGTKGLCQESMLNVCSYYVEGIHKEGEAFNNETEWLKEHDHPLHATYEVPPDSGHGGMDVLVVRAFIESVKRGIDPPIDTYDTALWSAITPISEQSIAQNGAPVEIPDFTKGKWFRREEPIKWKYSLDVVFDDPATPVLP